VVYLSSLLRAVIALHALVDNKATIGWAELEEGGGDKKTRRSIRIRRGRTTRRRMGKMRRTGRTSQVNRTLRACKRIPFCVIQFKHSLLHDAISKNCGVCRQAGTSPTRLSLTGYLTPTNVNTLHVTDTQHIFKVRQGYEHSQVTYMTDKHPIIL
jgi:hypothetical protein